MDAFLFQALLKMLITRRDFSNHSGFTFRNKNIRRPPFFELQMYAAVIIPPTRS
jgi:hypothetical protein